MSDGLDAAVVIFESEMLVRRVRVFVGKPEADENARHFKRVVHLGDEWDRAAFPNEYSLFAEAFLQRGLGHLENRSLVGRDPGLAGAQHFKSAVHALGKKLADMLFDEPGDFLRILIGHEPRGEFCVSL